MVPCENMNAQACTHKHMHTLPHTCICTYISTHILT